MNSQPRSTIAGFDGSALPMRTTGYWRTPVLAADDRLIGGVAAALARELGVWALLIRLVFVGLLITGRPQVSADSLNPADYENPADSSTPADAAPVSTGSDTSR